MKYLLLLILITSNMALAHNVIGVLKGKKEILIKTKSQGELTEINFKEGELVKAGDIIAVIDNEKELIEVKMSLNDFHQAKQEYLKSKKLKEYLSKDEVAKKKIDYEKKKSQYELKKYNLEAKNIKTPIDGVIAKKYLKQGENVSSGSKAFEVIQYGELEIDLYINAKYLSKLSMGKKLKISDHLNKTITYFGEVHFISPVLDKSSGTVHVKLRLDNEISEGGKYKLRPGTMVHVTIE